MNATVRSQPVATQGARRNIEWPADEVLHAGLTLIMAEAAKAHLKAGNLELASSCVQEAERFIALLPEPWALRQAV